MRIVPPRAVADLLPTAMPQLGERLLEHQIRRSWPEIVGREIASRARPAGLANGTLTVAVDNSPWLHELTLRAAELARRVSARVPAVRALRFTLGTASAVDADPAAAPRDRRPAVRLTADDLTEIDTAAAAIADPALADTARRLLTKARRYPIPRGSR
jgi:hypothetical protein